MDRSAASRSRRKPTRSKQLGVTDDDYRAMLDRQGGGCAICGATPKTRRLDVDHDHRTGAVRGLLCHRCNRALPSWVRAEWLRRAAYYLDTSSTDGDNLVDYLLGRIAQVFDGAGNRKRNKPQWSVTDAHMVELALGRRKEWRW